MAICRVIIDNKHLSLFCAPPAKLYKVPVAKPAQVEEFVRVAGPQCGARLHA